MVAKRRNDGLREEEYPKNSGILIREVPNKRDGLVFNISFKVTVPAKLTGAGRIRRNFKKREDAKLFAAEAFRAKKARGDSFFSLDSQLQNEVAALVPVLEESGQTLEGLRQLLKVAKGSTAKFSEVASGLDKLQERGLEFVDVVPFALAHLSPVHMHRSLSFVVEEMIALKESRPNEGKLADPSLEDFVYRARRMARELGEDMDIALVSRDNIFNWIKGLGLSARSNENYVRIAVSVFNHALIEGYVKHSPTHGLIGERRKALVGTKEGKGKGKVGILQVEQAQHLLEIARKEKQLGLLGFVTLSLFCGIRSEEAKQLDWSNVDLSEEMAIVTVPKDIAKKRRIRHVDIPPNGVEWLSLCHQDSGPIVEYRDKNHFDRKFRKLRYKAGFSHRKGGKEVSHWIKNGMRHSYGSYHFDKFGDSIKTSIQMGHPTNDDLLFANYRELVKRGEGNRFFSLRPQ
ncbi:tyrosine-type recombinase/integrase [Pelagicoccus albus]|uniref:Phage integrase family protein n=1 Tax=Pelagicoccus albus TaxID=415222 RepID=A0A7X1E8F0_9BACT|nr:hypothetical protein [Pelagicoccus albus]MBC2606078.1 hypothetical protein [Pelagicoccus albus]